ncbi:leukocyte elastase inhibitor isoform X2 [Callorhinchus milii]|nr:leukocyte elastase inhibitor isoform X2 [Callorhinchus milii]XP_007901254.1 leukocyte elastase inhibitor isoform X2 [Callorhinchus milii]XP_007901255.1 leukocyte elastase inhibitor isoform X2 [Callorhinchus milii]|eukprot:gi/632937826/ref/XP_007901251.1/ PREDICTED: leukocyte elastase inhibitor-like isoform X2 [Callorhinchus milii]
MDPMVAANVNFTLELFKKLNGNKNGNVFFSPLSVSAALGMVYLGAKGNTATQMGRVLHFSETDDIHCGFQALQDAFNKPNSTYLLTVANQLYVDKTYNLLPEFVASIRKLYQTDLEPVDFIKATEEARKQINSWIETKTNGKIQNLLDEGSIDDLTRLVLVNAIYFKGNWMTQFQKANTIERPFRITQNETKPMQMMHCRKRFNITCIKEIQCKILELPYMNNELSMIVLLPEDIRDNSTGLEQLEKGLTLDTLMDWTSPERMHMVEVAVALPKFKLEDQFDLESTLSDMGMRDAFDDTLADFSGMTEKNDLVLSKVVHKAYVEINEEGTEAAAATAVVTRTKRFTTVSTFEADHPFFFFIRHNKTHTILFFGRFCSP